MKTIRSGRAVLAFLLLLPWRTVAAEAEGGAVQGATRALTILEAAAEAGASKPGDAEKGQEPQQNLRRQFRSYTDQQDNLPPEQAAHAWADLWLALVKDSLTHTRGRWWESNAADTNQVTVAALLSHLPPPASWPYLEVALARAEASTPEARAVWPVLRALAAVLQQDVAGAERQLANVQEKGKAAAWSWGENLAIQVHQVRSEIHRTFVAEDTVATMLEDELTSPSPVYGLEALPLPDLVTLLGPQRAGDMLARLLRLPSHYLQIRDARTRALARDVALQHLEDLKTPPWSLASDLDSGPFYEAVSRSHAPSADAAGAEAGQPDVRGPMDYQAKRLKSEADAWYVAGLIQRGQTEQALAALADWPPEALADYSFAWMWERVTAGLPDEKVAAFYERALAANPQYPFWKAYLQVTARNGDAEQTLALLEKMERSAPAPGRRLAAVHRQKVDVLLAMDRVEEAVTLMRRLMEEPGADAGPALSLGDQMELALKLEEVGRLVQRADWREEGLQKGRALLRRLPEEDPYGGYRLSSIVERLLEAGRHEEAEADVLADLTRRLSTFRDPGLGSLNVDEPLKLLARVYARAGRPDDVLILLERCPWWQAADLEELLQGRDEGGLVVAAAEGLVRAGRATEADALLRDRVRAEPEQDGAYQMLADLHGTNLLPWLGQLAAADRFEERPLIWMAVVAQKAGRLADAETAARQALAVDPTDGEQSAGKRVLAYAVLGDILAGQGRTNDAAFFRHVVQSVRVAEEGDALSAAGLLRRSLAKYEEAEGLFADAYCVQWRLAERLRALGDLAGADRHYRIAFERMPEQFGRAASFCFGCEGVFAAPHRRSVAETVLTDLAAQTNPRPQVFYLVGQLREAQDRLREAVSAYQRAVALDGDYLDAWVRLYDLRQEVFLPPAQRNELALRLLALDPLWRHHARDLAGISDFHGLWKAAEAGRQAVPPSGTAMLALLAAEQRREQVARLRPGNPREGHPYPRSYREPRPEVLAPGALLALHPVVVACQQLLDQLLAAGQQEQFMGMDTLL